MSRVIITQVGPYPPPYGGVSTHVQRLRRRLQGVGIEAPVWCAAGFERKENGIRCLPARRRPACYWGWLLDSCRELAGQIVHFHELRPYSLWIVMALWRKHRVVVTVHNQFMLEERTFFSRLSQWVVRSVGPHRRFRIIAVNSRIEKQLLALGVPRAHISVIPAFLPSEDPVRVEDLAMEIREFGARRRPLLAAYGIRCAKSPVWGDLYGFDLSLEALKILRHRYPRIGLVVLTPNNQSQPYFQELGRRARHLGVEQSVLWWTDSMPDATPLWKFSDVYLRPTSTDGDAIAVREALAAGTPVVASDASERPSGTEVFPSGNLAAFAAAIATALGSGRRPAAVDGRSGFDEIMHVYRQLVPELAGVNDMVGQSSRAT